MGIEGAFIDGVNDAGMVAGACDGQSAVFNGGVTSTFSIPGYVTAPLAINDAGVIAGHAAVGSFLGPSHGFLPTLSVPEPATVGMLLVGAALLCVFRSLA